MSVYDWKSADSGSWNTASNWSPTGGPVVTPSFFGPVSSDTALFATGSHKAYTVTGSGLAEKFDISGDTVTFAEFTVNGDATSPNFLVEKNADVTFAADSAFRAITHDGYGGGSVTIDHATLTVYGQMSAADTTVQDHGTLIVSGTAASIPTILGGVGVDATSTLELLDGAKASDGGAFGAQNVAGKVIVDGAGSSFTVSGYYGTGFTGSASVSNGGSLSVPDVSSKVTLSDGTLSATAINIGGKVTGSGTLTAPTNDGTITAKGGTLSVTGPVAGTGSFTIGAQSTLVLNGESDEHIKFTGADGKLQLAPSVGATGFISGFVSGDEIIVKTASSTDFLTSVTETKDGADTILKAYAGTTLMDTFTVGGHIASGAIGVSYDYAGGSVLYFPGSTSTGVMATHTT